MSRPGFEADALDVLIVGAGPTGIVVGAELARAGAAVLLIDQGGLCASLQAYPTDLEFFTTRERLEIAGVPFAIPEAKPSRRQALVYYREVVRRFELPLALEEKVTAIRPEGDGFSLESDRDGEPRLRRARSVVVATGFFTHPRRLAVPGVEASWVQHRYLEPYPHFGQRVALVGGGNSAAKIALDLWRNGAEVTVIHRRADFKPTLKYWIRPDLDNRIAEGSIAARFDTVVTSFETARERLVHLRGPEGDSSLAVDRVYVQIGYEPDPRLLLEAGVDVDPASRVPAFDEATCETGVPGLYVAGTVQAGIHTGRLFIENSRDHGTRIARHWTARRGGRERPASGT
jgi:thioredoxin reductase (NADPH)